MNFVVCNDQDETKVLCFDCIIHQERPETEQFTTVIEPVEALPCEDCACS